MSKKMKSKNVNKDQKSTKTHTISTKSYIKQKNKKKRKIKFSNPRKLGSPVSNCKKEKVGYFPLRPSTSETSIDTRKSNVKIVKKVKNFNENDCLRNRGKCDLNFEEDSPVSDIESNNYFDESHSIIIEGSSKQLQEDYTEEENDGFDNSSYEFVLEASKSDNEISDREFSDTEILYPDFDNSDIPIDDEEKYSQYKIDSKYIIVLNHSQKLSIFGYCDIKVLFGSVDILGYKLTVESPRRTIHSLRGSSLLTINNPSSICHELELIKTLVPTLTKQDIIFHNLKVRKDSSIFILSTASSDMKINLIENHISQQISPCKISTEPCVEIEPKGQWNVMNVCQDWYDILEKVTSSFRLFICGGKGVGKSTFMRFSINRLLQSFNKVQVIDLDPGQSEFTPPGSLSIVTVDEPLFGMNYTHLKGPNRSILCDISISSDPHKYIQSVRQLMKNFNYRENVPVLINYMGYTDDLAFNLVSSAIAVVRPTEVIYICSANRKKNFKIPMSNFAIKKNCKLFGADLDINFNVKITKVSSITDDNKGWTLEARQMREMCILAYFAGCLKEPVYSLQSYKLPLYELDLSDIKVTDKNNAIVPAEELNANMVALCALVDENTAIFQCFGWGIVRGVNPAKNFLIIFTPIEEKLLKNVTNIVAGTVFLPPAVYMNHENVQGHVPYVMEGELVDFAQISKRTHIPHKNITRMF